jgi:hypothetical protein
LRHPTWTGSVCSARALASLQHSGSLPLYIREALSSCMSSCKSPPCSTAGPGRPGRCKRVTCKPGCHPGKLHTQLQLQSQAASRECPRERKAHRFLIEYGKQIAARCHPARADIRQEIAAEVAALKAAKGLALVHVGARKDSEMLVRSKKKACAEAHARMLWPTEANLVVSATRCA